MTFDNLYNAFRGNFNVILPAIVSILRPASTSLHGDTALIGKQSFKNLTHIEKR